AIYFTFGKLIWQYLRSNHFDNLSPEQQWHAIQQVRKQLENPNAFYIQQATGKIILSLLDVGGTVKEIVNPITAVTEFYSYYTQYDAFVREKTSVVSG